MLWFKTVQNTQTTLQCFAYMWSPEIEFYSRSSNFTLLFVTSTGTVTEIFIIIKGSYRLSYYATFYLVTVNGKTDFLWKKMAGYRHFQLNKICPFSVDSLNDKPLVSERRFRD